MVQNSLKTPLRNIKMALYTSACKTYVPSLTGKCFFLGGMALNLVSFQFSKMSIPPNILPTVSLLGPVSAEDRRTRSMGKLSSFKLSMFKIDEAEPRSMAASVLVLQTKPRFKKEVWSLLTAFLNREPFYFQ